MNSKNNGLQHVLFFKTLFTGINVVWIPMDGKDAHNFEWNMDMEKQKVKLIITETIFFI